jgi:hypothetical protein
LLGEKVTEVVVTALYCLLKTAKRSRMLTNPIAERCAGKFVPVTNFSGTLSGS